MNTYLTALASRFTVAITLATAAGIPSLAHAQTPDSLPAYWIEGITVTTPRSGVARNQNPQKIDVVGGTELERTGARDVATGLRSTTPVDVITYPGLLSGVAIRGFRPSYSGILSRTLLLINGRPAGTNNLAIVSLSGVERIEVLHGPASSLYGSSAMGGVINVITSRSTGELHGRVASSYGSFGQYNGQVSLGGTLANRVDFDLDLAGDGQSQGYRTGTRRTFAGDSLPKLDVAGARSQVPWVTADTVVDFTEYRSQSGRLRLGYDVSDAWRLTVQGEGFRGDGVQNPGDLNPVGYDSRSLKDVSRGSAEVLVEGHVAGQSPMLRLFSSFETIDYYSGPVAPHFVNFSSPIRTLGGQLQDELRFGSSSLVVGGDYTGSDIDSRAFSAAGVASSPFAPNSSIRSTAIFAQGRTALLDERLVVSAGARIDRVTFSIRETPNFTGAVPNSEDHQVFSPNLGARFTLSEGLQLYGSVGKAFVTPEAFFVAGYSESRTGTRKAVRVTQGNPELDPENSRTWEGGVSFFDSSSRLEAELGYFNTKVDDRITTGLSTPTSPTLTARGDTILSITSYQNVDVANISGLEGRVSYDLGPLLQTNRSLRLFAAGTRILTAEDRVVATDATRPIFNVADLTLISGVEYDDLQLFNGRIAGRYVGERSDNDYVAWWAPGQIDYPAYMVVDAHAGVQFGRYNLNLDLNNVLDEDYFEVRGYNLPGRQLRGGITIGL